MFINSTYSLAFAALIHPDEIDRHKAIESKHKQSNKLVPRVDLLNDERDGIFTSALLIVVCQVVYLNIMIKYFLDNPFVPN